MEEGDRRKEVCLQPLGRTHPEQGAQDWSRCRDVGNSGQGPRPSLLVLLVGARPGCPVWGPRGCDVAGLPALGVLLHWACGAWRKAGVPSRHLRPEGVSAQRAALLEKFIFQLRMGDKPEGIHLEP